MNNVNTTIENDDDRAEDEAEKDREIGRNLCRKGYHRDYCESSEQEHGWDLEHWEAEEAAEAKRKDRELLHGDDEDAQRG